MARPAMEPAGGMATRRRRHRAVRGVHASAEELVAECLIRFGRHAEAIEQLTALCGATRTGSGIGSWSWWRSTCRAGRLMPCAPTIGPGRSSSANSASSRRPGFGSSRVTCSTSGSKDGPSPCSTGQSRSRLRGGSAARRSCRPRFIGRSRELATLDEQLEQALSGSRGWWWCRGRQESERLVCSRCSGLGPPTAAVVCTGARATRPRRPAPIDPSPRWFVRSLRLPARKLGDAARERDELAILLPELAESPGYHDAPPSSVIASCACSTALPACLQSAARRPAARAAARRRALGRPRVPRPARPRSAPHRGRARVLVVFGVPT